jgi:hypothetical protein
MRAPRFGGKNSFCNESRQLSSFFKKESEDFPELELRVSMKRRNGANNKISWRKNKMGELLHRYT